MKERKADPTDETRFSGAYLGIRERRGWEYATRTNATGVVVIVAVTPDREIILVEQHRIPVGRDVIELPAGLVGDEGEPDEPSERAAERELWEETGYRARRLVHLSRCPSSAGMSDEMLDFYLAEDAVREGAGGGDASEDIRVHTVPLDEVDAWLARAQGEGKAYDPKVYTGLYWLERRATLATLLPRPFDAPETAP